MKLKQGRVLRGVLKDQSGQIRPNAEFHLNPAQSAKRGHGYQTQTVRTDGQGRFKAYLGDTDYSYYARRSLGKDANGHLSYSVNSVDLRPGRDQNVTVVIDSLER